MSLAERLTQKKSSDQNRDPRLLREVVYEQLKEAIRHGELQPGEPLSETSLSQALNISRTPVREALQQLAQEGLVQKTPNRSVTVTEPSFQDVLNILHVRTLVEPEIARLAAKSMSEEELDLMTTTVDEMAEAAQRDDRSTWIEADTVYHETLSDTCPNALLGQLGLQMRNRMQYLATDSQITASRLIEGTEEHRQILAAIAERDAEAAEEAMREHLRQVRTGLFNRLAHM